MHTIVAAGQAMAKFGLIIWTVQRGEKAIALANEHSAGTGSGETTLPWDLGLTPGDAAIVACVIGIADVP
jgi:hypothetical protein